MNPDLPTVSILIPTFNYARFLPQAIDSALAQTVKPLEIVVADDGSTDNTAEIVARYGNAVTYRRFEHQGVYAIRQAMLAELRGEWFLNLDADDWIEPDFLEKALAMVASQRNDPTLAFVYPDITRFGEMNDVREFPDFSLARLKRGNYVVMSSLIRRGAAREAGFDANFNDGQGDYDFYLTLAKMGYRGERLPGGLMHVRVHGGSISGLGRAQFRQVELAEKILAKHDDLFSARESRQLRRNARRGASQAMWRAVEQHYAAEQYRQAWGLGLRAIWQGPRHVPCRPLALMLRALVGSLFRGRDVDTSTETD
ncbi:MAG: glycosyltransferase family 2 protein [Lentisphaerae bacterium]|jgi:glycosyltransferase involved in cell wall biosynthesis|nr:glycosyltransferase family 2 protein [Lentisphaerota bacterium]